MYGAIIGDVAGSYYEVLEVNAKKAKTKRSYQERIKIMDRSNNLFDNNSSCTDDSVLTVAIADAILNNGDYEAKLKEYGLREINLGVDMYGRSRFGSGFTDWLNGNSAGNSHGNGCAMRISPVGNLFTDISKVKEESKKATIPTHNNQDAIISSEAVAVAIFLLKNKMPKIEVKKYIENNYFKLDFDIESLRQNYTFSSKAIESVPQAMYCFFISKDFEDAIRIAISIGGDSDTIAAITGSIAESYYGVPNNLIEQVKPYIMDYMFPIINKFYNIEKEKVYERNN